MRPICYSVLLALSVGTLLAQNPSLPAATQVVAADAPSSAPAEPKRPVSFDLKSIDTNADPCTDFYQYSCGNWMKNNPVPSDQVRWGRFNELAERNRWLLYNQLETAAAHPASPLQTQFGNFYAACMDATLTNSKGYDPIKPLLAQVDALTSTQQLASLVAQLQSQDSTRVLFGFGSQQDEKDSTKQIAAVFQGGLGLPDRDYYTEKDARSSKIREQYLDHMTKMFQLIGDSPEQAATEAKSVMAIETALAEGSLTRTMLRDPANRYHLLPVSDLKTLAPGFDWDAYFKGVNLKPVTQLNIGTPNFLKALNTQIAGQDLAAWKSYLRWHVTSSAAAYLAEPFFNENFNFYSKTLSGQKEPTPLWKRCTALTDRALGEAVGQDWVKQNFPPDAKDNMTKLVAALDTALGEDIRSLPWMSDATKAEAEKKLAAIRNKIGYPDKWRDYSTLTVKRDDLLGNVARSGAFQFAYELNKIGTPVDEKEWGMTPPTVNAYYDPSNNDINFPAGILQPPFFDNSKDPAVNFGGIGVVIGHEMTHGFDDEGSKYDEKGNLREWYTAEDRKKFTERTDCEVKEYSSFEAAPGQNVKGELTLGENTADNGGIRIAYMALMNTLAQQGTDAATQKIDGYTPAQRYFISFGQIWCENRTEQAARLAAKTDPHSPGHWRTNGTVQNYEEFGKAFGCKKGQPMMPENACRVW